MKGLLKLLVLFLISASSFSQSLTKKMTDILNQVGKNLPADQLFMHLDRNLYHAGDTIWFQAYIRDSRTGVFETESSSLYAILLNSKHVTIDSARFRISSPTVPGWLKVPDDVPPGDYTIMAFTSINMNYSPEFAFIAPIKIDKVFPVRNETRSNSKNEVASLSQIPLELPQIDLRFLPEGGTFISGIQQRLAFNAVKSTGRSVEVTGVITNQKGEKITEFRSTPYGPGIVEFIPLSGDSYYATIAGEEFKGVKWSLPSPEKSGVTMRVDNTGDGLLDISLKGREIDGRSYFLTIIMNNILVFSADVRLDTLFRKRIQTDKLPSGTAFITLYDHELNPVSERLIFLNYYKKMNVEVGVSSSLVFPGDETELTVNTTDDKGNSISSILSLAVIDSLSGYYGGIPMPEIESAYLFDKEFYNNLPFGIRSRGLRNIDSKSIDILLMTYGWRRFHPQEIIPDNSEKELVNYDFLKIINPGPLKKSKSEIKLMSIENLDVLYLKTNKNREAVLFFDSLDAGVRQIVILPDNDPFKNINPVRIVFPENKDYTDKAKLLKPDQNYFIPDFNVINNTQPAFNLDNIIIIESVIIKEMNQPPGVYVDKHAKMFQSGGISTMYSKDFVSENYFEDILFRYNPFRLDRENKTIYLRAFSSNPALIVLDNTPIDTSYMTIATLPASQIASVTILRGIQGTVLFGAMAIGGIVFVTTKTGSGYSDYQFRRNDDLMKVVRLFRTETEYYIPTKEEVSVNPEFQFRPTILWKDDVFVDKSGTVKIKYPNNLVKGTAMVFVNGISFTNLVGSNRCSYKVK